MFYTSSMMADQVNECSVSNTLLSGNGCSVIAIKEEECKDEDIVDDKVQITETAITTEVQDNLICDKIEQYDILSTLDNIKTELSLPKIQCDDIHDTLKAEEISADNIKIEFNNGLLYCEDCQVYRENYCAECDMLVHILNKIVPINGDNISREELPHDILEIRYYMGEYHIFALKFIPAGVKFGPFTGLNPARHMWKIKGGKFSVNKNDSKYLNWMQYINPARNILEQNLQVFQYERNIYYESTRPIEVGNELLVHFGGEYEDSLNRNVETDFTPTTDHIFKDVFACLFCCLGFSSKSYLAKHKTICPENAVGEFTIEELIQCPSCKIHLHQEEYFTHHMAYCCDRKERKCILPTTDDRTTPVLGRKPRPRQLYKCQQCKYRTNYKGDLKNHTDLHYEVKMYKCGVCYRRFKTEEVLKLHVENTHICVGENEDLKQSAGDFMKEHIKAEHSRSQSEMKQLKCSMCGFRTQYKRNLKRHTAAKHLREFKYKCDTCDYKTNWRGYLKAHINTRHLKEFKYKCDTCDYKSNYKFNLQKHTEGRHSEEFKYKCDVCDYRTKCRFSLKTHVEGRHLKKLKYWCDACDYKANQKSQLKTHVERKHLKQFKYKCDTCDYKTNLKGNLKSHIGTKHLKEFKYKCGTCDYKSYRIVELKAHIKTRHLKEFKYKCDTCDYTTNYKQNLQKHVVGKHLNEFKYKCDTCDHTTNYKQNLQTHIEGRHSKEFKYKCDTCDYKTNLKGNLMRHIKTIHLKEFKYKCDRCDYKATQQEHLKSHIQRRHLKELRL